ncbi:unnamed protein product [Closterium sp. NIES-54]
MRVSCPVLKRWNFEVLDACALRTDLALMPRGDESLVEEGGGNLSGGQRARMSLARAAYAALHCKMTFESTLKSPRAAYATPQAHTDGNGGSNSSSSSGNSGGNNSSSNRTSSSSRNAPRPVLVLLDDPLAALDPAVASHVFQQCVCGLLAGLPRIVVTHHVQYLGRVLVLNGGRAAACGAWSNLCALPSAQQNCDNPPLPFAQLLKPLKAFEAPQSTWSDICTLPSAQQHCDHPPPALGQPLSGGRGVSDTGSDSAMCATVTVSGTVVCAPVTTDTGVDGTFADSRSCKSGTTVVCSSKRDTGSDSAMCATVTGGDCAAAGNATVTTNTGVDGTVVHSQRCKTGDTAGSSSGSCVDRGTGSERDTDAPTVGTRGCRVGIHGDSSVRGSEERAEVEQAEAAALIRTGDEVEKIQLTEDGIHRNTSLRGSENEVLLGTEAEVETAEVGKGVVDACREGERVSLEDQAAEGSLCKSREGAAKSYSLFRRGEGEQEESGSTEGDEQGLLDVEGWQRGAIPLSVFWGYARKIRVLPLLLFAALFLAAHVSNALVSWFLGLWTEAPETTPHPLVTLAAIALSCVALSLLSSLLIHFAALRASSRMHSLMLSSVLASPLAFFHRNPTGRVLNRFSEDLGVTDDVLPQLLLDFLNVS